MDISKSGSTQQLQPDHNCHDIKMQPLRYSKNNLQRKLSAKNPHQFNNYEDKISKISTIGSESSFVRNHVKNNVEIQNSSLASNSPKINVCFTYDQDEEIKRTENFNQKDFIEFNNSYKSLKNLQNPRIIKTKNFKY